MIRGNANHPFLYKCQTSESMLEQKILSYLQNVGQSSIQEVAGEFALDADAVKAAIDDLIEIGVPIEWKSNYRLSLPATIRSIDSEFLRLNLRQFDSDLARNSIVLARVDSTNQYLLDKIRSQNVHKHVCIAEHMTQGRGRQKRKWVGGAFQNILLSLGWKFNAVSSGFTGLSLAIAVMVANCLHQTFSIDIQVKWPNDILYKNQKLCGILIEINNTTAVIGVGLNCNLTNREMQGIDASVTSLYEILQMPIDRNQVLVQLLRELKFGLERFSVDQLNSFRSKWIELHAFQDQRVGTSGNLRVEGVARGIDEHGALILELDSGKHYRVNAGEISLRRSS